MKSRSTPRLLPASTTLVLLLGAVSSCSTSQIGVTNTLGTIETMIDAEPDEIIRAAEEVVADLGLHLVSSDATKIDGRLIATTARDREVKIETEVSAENVSEISIRVGSGLGDEALSLQILNAIKDKLKRRGGRSTG